ncbi:arylsulfatase [Coniella lustricola]|uniref:Arylsulfatase n=1 Tax=Coniella lustricola TaxID=2025994 RepID=A0A2T3AA83_9PEZI|nr:arylsulfatase [Coniella lustricola]
MKLSLVSFAALAVSVVQAKQPNILFVLTDDQDIELGSLDYLDSVTGKIQGEGFTFNNHYTTVALCCPSRAAMLRGQQAHNTNNTYVTLPGGSFSKFQASGEDADNLPHYMHRAGYRAEFIGKIMNGYASWNWDTPPAGWDRFDGMLDPWMYTYNTPVFSIDGAIPRYYNGSYLQDVVHAKAYDRIDKLTAANATDQPWFLMVAPTAPHATFNETGDWAPVPAARHRDLFPNVTAPRTPNFNPAVNSKPSWVGQLPLMNSSTIEVVDEYFRARVQALQSVNEMIDNLIALLDSRGELDNTVIVFSADHGYHLGNHRIPCGKTLPYKEDTHVPFAIRGPGVPKGLSTNIPSNHIDIAPTLLDLAGLDEADWPSWLDGRSLLPYFTATNSSTNNASATALLPGTDPVYVETVNIEYWGQGIVEATAIGYSDVFLGNATYKTARVIAEDYSYMYAVWCTGETELYNLTADPYELYPVLASDSDEAARLTTRMNGLLLLLKTCIGQGCRAPWTVLHPDGAVKSLADALDPQYDALYAALPSVSYDVCATEYLHANEAPYFSSNYSALFAEITTPHQDAADYGNQTAGTTTDTIGWNGTYFGAVYEDLATMEARARDLTPEELDWETSAKFGIVRGYMDQF